MKTNKNNTMKKSFFSLIVLLIVSSYSLKAQINLIAVQHGNTPSFYQQVDDAIVNAQDGDTIYIPGGTWNITQAINKRLHIIGVGHHPDSTIATFPTTLNGNFLLNAGASNGSVKGLIISANILVPSEQVSFYTVCRCHILMGLYFSQTSNNNTFIENIIEGQIYGNNSTNFSFFNNIFVSYYPSASTSEFINSIFKNNIFLISASTNYYPIRTQYSLIEDNIFFCDAALYCVSNSLFKNNLFECAWEFPYYTNNGYNNIINQVKSSIFVNQSGNAFSYSHDYHLQSSCPGKNAGTDGTDIGIYGGQYPWKDGSVPNNPHITISNIGGNTNSNGALPVNIKVSAQGN